MCITRGLANKRSSELLIQINEDDVIRKDFVRSSKKTRADEYGESLVHEGFRKESDSIKVRIVAEKAVSSCGVKIANYQDKAGTKIGKSRYFVEHKAYVDRSEFVPEVPPDKKKVRGGASIPFPLQLHQMLDDAENSGLTSIVSWRVHGRAFMVHKRDEFVDRILPYFFHQNKFASFQRQLNLYGFSRISTGKDKGAYYHEWFLKGRQLLTSKMTRTKVKGNSIRGSSNPYAEPNFYRMNPLGPLKRETLNKIYDVSCNLINEHMAQILGEEIIKMFSSYSGNNATAYDSFLPYNNDTVSF